MRRVGIRAGDVRDPERFAKLIRERATIENKLIGEAGGEELNIDEMVEQFSALGNSFGPVLGGHNQPAAQCYGGGVPKFYSKALKQHF